MIKLHIALAPAELSGPLHRTIAQWVLRGALLAAASLLMAPVAMAQSLGNTLPTNQAMRTGEFLQSTNKQFTASLGTDGLVLIKGLNGSQDWFMPGGRKPDNTRSFVMQGDGNLCLNGPEGSGLWCSYSNRGPGDYFAVLRDSGDFEVYRGTPRETAKAELLWTSLLKTNEYANRYPDLKAAFGTDAGKLMQHWVLYGRYEGRAPRASVSDEARTKALAINLDTRYYASKYPDLRAAFGYDAQKLLDHYNSYGRRESRYPNQPTEAFQERPVGPVKGGNHLRNGDFISDKEFLVSPNKRWIMFVQGDGNVCVNEAASPAGANERNRKWCKNTRSLQGGRYAAYVTWEGQLCTEAMFAIDVSQRKNCGPMGPGPGGSYYGELQDDANFVIHKGMGPQDERGAYWDWMSRQPSRGFNIGAVAESVAKFVVNTANLTASQTTRAAESSVHVTADAAVALGNETADAAKVVARTTVEVANQTADIANTVIDALRTNCSSFSRYFPDPLVGIQGVTMLAEVINRAAPNVASAETLACATEYRAGYYCQIPQELVNLVKDVKGIADVTKKAAEEAIGDECKYSFALAGPPMFFAAAPLACGAIKLMVNDGVKMGRCISAAANAGLLWELTGTSKPGGPSVQAQACNLAGKVTAKVGKMVLTRQIPAGSSAKMLYDGFSRSATSAKLLEKLQDLPDCR